MADSKPCVGCSDRFGTAMILSGMKLLIATPDKLQLGIGMTEQISINLSQVHTFLSQRDMKDEVLAIREHYGFDGKDRSDSKWNFVREALVLLVMLCKSLKKQKPMADGEDLPPVLSVGDEETIRNVLHFISLLGIYPYLCNDVGISLQARTKCNIGCIKSSLSLSMRNFMLYSCLNVLHDCSGHETLGPYIISSSVLRCDMLTSLIQISHYNNVKVQAPLSDCSLGYCKDWLEALISRIGDSVLMKDLLVLQSRRSLKWFNVACGVLLSRKLMEKNGLLTLLNAIFQDTKDGVGKPSDIWLKCNAVSKVVSASPSQAKSASNYYEQICPQVLLLIESEDHVLVMVSSSIISSMISCHYNEAMQYLILPLFSPLMSLTYEESLTISFEKLSSCLITFDKVLTVSKPGSSFFSVAAGFLPILFMLWILYHEQQHEVNVHMKRLPIKQVLKKVFKANDFAIQLQFFHQLLRIPYDQSPSIRFKTVPEPYIIVTKDDGILLEKNSDGSRGYEAYGEIIVELLMDSDIADSKLIGTVLSACVGCIASLVTNEENLFCNEPLSVGDQNQLFPMKGADNISFIYSTVVLYVTAAICENISEKVLNEVNLLSLVQSVINIVKCYAAYVLEKQEIRIKEDYSFTLIFGSNATLSIAFGLLSAILSANKNIPTSIRPFLFDVLPQLETLSQRSDIPEYAEVAREIQICISTLGAVWSESNISHKDTQKQAPEVRIVGKESSSRISECKDVVKETVHVLSKPSGFPEVLENVFKMLEDPLIPVQGHNLIELARLIERKDCCIIEHKDFIVATLSKHLQHQDSYIYMNAIRGLLAMASIDASKVVSLLCSHYTCCKSKGLEDQPSDENITTESTEEWIMKVGEAIVKVTQSLGEVLPFHHDQLVSAFLINVKHPESLIRASALSNLAEVLSYVGIKYTGVENEILSVLSTVLKHECCDKVKQAAILVIRRIFGSVESLSLMELPDSVLQMYRLLKHVESTDSDTLTRICAQDALSELNKQMKEKVFPVPKLTKKITVLPD